MPTPTSAMTWHGFVLYSLTMVEIVCVLGVRDDHASSFAFFAESEQTMYSVKDLVPWSKAAHDVSPKEPTSPGVCTRKHGFQFFASVAGGCSVQFSDIYNLRVV